MTSKELVEKCEKVGTCERCQDGEICDAYKVQFKCYPFEARKQLKYTPEVYSDIQIQFS